VLRLKGLLLPHAAKFGGFWEIPEDFFVAQSCLPQAGSRKFSTDFFRRDLAQFEVHLKPTL
jgi:hypothetical protein